MEAKPKDTILYQVDAFTDKPFAGNPAAICILEKSVSVTWMKLVAAEMNLSETAFLWPEGAGFRLRWFTPEIEVDLCGHATLAATHILFEKGYLTPAETVSFYTKSGLLTAQLVDGMIQMDFPAVEAEESDVATELIRSLGNVTPIYTGKSRKNYLIVLPDESSVKNLTPDFGLMLTMLDRQGIIVTAESTSEGVDFVSRYFAPPAGINEDPVTGSAHCTLAPYWAAILGKTELVAEQISKRRGTLYLNISDERVLIKGNAVTTLIATLAPVAAEDFILTASV